MVEHIRVGHLIWVRLYVGVRIVLVLWYPIILLVVVVVVGGGGGILRL